MATPHLSHVPAQAATKRRAAAFGAGVGGLLLLLAILSRLGVVPRSSWASAAAPGPLDAPWLLSRVGLSVLLAAGAGYLWRWGAVRARRSVRQPASP